MARDLLVVLFRAVWMLLPIGCGAVPSPKPAPAGNENIAPFVDGAADTGLVFHHENGMTGARYMVEVVGSGCALLDYDRDGDLDLFLVQGGPLGPDAGTEVSATKKPSHRLFRNDLKPTPSGDARLTFTDVSEAAGLADFRDYGMGAAAGDYDGDGWVDLLITAFGNYRLLRNTRQGTFSDETSAAGLMDEPGWSTSAAWVDYDRDGDLDLFVCHYLLWNYALHQTCRSPGGKADYCGPTSFALARSRLYQNLGGGKFANVSVDTRIGTKAGAALGVVSADWDENGWPDLLVANDGMSNHLWLNQGNGRFLEQATERGCAVNAQGKAEANMGVIAADFHNAGRCDLLITHLANEHATFYRNLGAGQFADVTAAVGIDAPTRPYTGFGTGAIDFDNDGWLDLFITNGAVRIDDQQLLAGVKLPLRQRSLLLRHRGGAGARFESVRTGAFLQVEEVGRGAAFGDLDNDGDLDIVVCNNAGPVRLLLNQVGNRKHWLGLRLLTGPPEARVDALGASARLEREAGTPLWRRVAVDGSYLSSSDPRLLFGLGDTARVARVVVRWPDGQEETWPGLAVDRYHELVRGTAPDHSPRQ